MVDALPDRTVKGRGAVGNPTGRYEPLQRLAIDDGWVPGDDQPPPLRTTVTEDASRSVISRNDSPDIGFDRTINPYRGCEHGCVYCFARPTHAWLGLSPGLDFESRLFAKRRAAELLECELSRRGYRCRPILLGANTDPYQPVERDLCITRAILEVLAAFNHPVAIATKSNLVLRDVDILGPMAERRLATVGVSVTTLDRALARKMEPRAPTPARRIEALEGLSAAGVPTAVMAAPMIPALNDAELERILETGARAGARAASYVLVRLPLEIKDLFSDWLEAHVPDRARHVLSLVRQARGGKLYESEFGTRMRGRGPYADLLAQRFRLACARLGLNAGREHGAGLDSSRFRAPLAAAEQLRLL